MILSVSDEDPRVIFRDEDDDPVTISILEDGKKDDDDILFEKLMNMPDKDLKKYLAENKYKVKSINKKLNKKSKKKYIQDGKRITLDNKSMKIIPRKDRGREIVYIFGPSGSGKSVFCSNYAKAYSTINPDNRIFLFSRVGDDDSIDEIEPTRIPLNEANLANLDIFDLEDSLCIFDDTDTISKNKVSKLLDKIKNDIVEMGRHPGISCLVTTHTACNYAKTRTILNETHKLVIFPGSGSDHQNEYLLNKYGGLSKPQTSDVMKLPSRWACVSTSMPKHVIHENGMYLL